MPKKEKYPEVLQVRVRPQTKSRIEQYIKKMNENTNSAHVYTLADFLRSAIEEKLGLVERRIELVTTTNQERETIERVFATMPIDLAERLVSITQESEKIRNAKFQQYMNELKEKDKKINKLLAKFEEQKPKK